jgi:tetratricopeptide (TPR) repeat protein
VDNPRLHLNELSFQGIFQTFHALPPQGTFQSEKLYRPVACLSFALNWYFGKDRVFGYHLVNISIHLLTAFFLYITLLYLFESPNLKDRYKEIKRFVSLLAVVIWAIHPIQTQAITYIVQRMASLSAMFSILSLLFYMKARMCPIRYKRFSWFAGAFLAFIFAIGSKENAGTLPIAVFFLEIIFFYSPTKASMKTIFRAGISTICMIIIVAVFVCYYMRGSIDEILSMYEIRPFSLSERFMTEARILVFYLSQLVYPIVTRFSIGHDVLLSTTLFRPWTTLPSIVFIFLLFGLALGFIRKYPFFSFAVLFFLTGHLVESTIIPLELIFEHRNYLPSMFLFVPLGIGIKRMIDYYKIHNLLMSNALICFSIALMVALGTGTYIRNLVWATEQTLWEDAMEKAPLQARPLINLASVLLNEYKDYNKGLELYQKALQLQSSEIVPCKSNISDKIGKIYMDMGEDDKAQNIFQEILNKCPNYTDTNVRYYILRLLLKKRHWDAASFQAEMLLKEMPYYLPDKHKYIFNIRGLIYLNQGFPDRALAYFRKAMKADPYFWQFRLNAGVALLEMGKYDRSRIHLNKAVQMKPDEMMPLLKLIENCIKSGDKKQKDVFIERLIRSFTLIQIQEQFKPIEKGSLFISFSKSLLVPAIVEKIETIKRDIHDETQQN